MTPAITSRTIRSGDARMLWFIRECCLIGPLYTETSAALFRAFARWCRKYRVPYGTIRMFAMALKEFQLPRARGSRYGGVRLKKAWQIPEEGA